MNTLEPAQALTVNTRTLWAQCRTCLDSFDVELRVNGAGQARVEQMNVRAERLNGRTVLRHGRCGGLLGLWGPGGNGFQGRNGV